MIGHRVRAHVLEMDVHDAVAVTPGHRLRVAASEREVPRIEQQPDRLSGARHQQVDLGLRLDDGPHVVVVSEAQAVLLNVLGHPR